MRRIPLVLAAVVTATVGAAVAHAQVTAQLVPPIKVPTKLDKIEKKVPLDKSKLDPPKLPLPPKAPDPREVRAKAAVETLRTQLQGALKTALDAGGPIAAIPVCNTSAPTFATALSKDGLEVGRTSSKLRNPKNAARAWVLPILSDLEKKPDAERGPVVVKLPSGALGYVEPIKTGALCLQCHGASVAPDVQKAISALYPTDQAVGYAEGELRGVFWVEVK